jgi:hypothetical protein
MSETYHGVEIPEDIWLSWNDAFEEGPHGFRLGVRAARGIRSDSPADREERARLASLAKARNDAEQAAWQAQHDRYMAAFEARKGQG